MTKSRDAPKAGVIDGDADDTIELELTEAEIRMLSQALPVETMSPSPVPQPTPLARQGPNVPRILTPPTRRARWVVGYRRVVAASIVVSAVALPFLTRMSPRTRAAAVTVSSPTVSLPPAPPQAQDIPVRFTNPFDANEVFEFPQGTSESDARQAVADLLSTRARERQRAWATAPRRNRRIPDRGAGVTLTEPMPRS
jgi:hypothetical protein